MNSFSRGLMFAILFLTLSIGFTNCSPVGSSTSGGTTVIGTTLSGPNVIGVTIGCEYPNEPCVSVTVCQPGTSNCQTIPNILLDTGSYGLRVFSSALTLSLTNEADPNATNATIAECISYGDGSSDWGPVAKADVQLSSELASNIPIQIIQANYGTAPSLCHNIETSPSDSGFNGILGVGLMVQDCGAACAPGASGSASNNIYYSCNNSTKVCTGTTVALTMQTANPISHFATDNNGLILELPGVPTSGATSAIGSLIFGIGTQTNNTPVVSKVSIFPANATKGTFTTTYKGTTFASSFIDSGSNGVFFPDSSITQCSGNEAGLYCPTSELSLSAVQVGSGVSNTINFPVGNAVNEFAAANANMVFPDLAGPLSISGAFDWGLPFFLGRNVYVQFATTASQGTNRTTLGTGPLWAY